MNWQKTRLGEICRKIGSGATPTGGANAYCEKGVSLIRSQNVLDFVFSWQGLAHINKAQAAKLDNVIIEDGDILLNITGDSVARCCIVDSHCLPARVNQHVMIIRVDKLKANNRFLLYSLLILKDYLLSVAASGSTRNALTKAFVENLEISLPPLPIQRAIAERLGRYDALIENNTRRIAILERMAQELYKEWFVRRRGGEADDISRRDAEPQRNVTGRAAALPKGWKIGRIGDYCEAIGGGTPSTANPDYWNGSLKWVTPTDITSKSSIPLLKIEKRITEKGLKNSSSKLLPPYTILMTSRASIGYFGICPEPVCTNQGFIAIVPKHDYLRMYFLQMLKSRREEIILNANGSTFLEISRGRFRKMKMVLPNEETLRKFEARARRLFDMVLSLERQNANLARQRDLLLPRLMSGKMEVASPSRFGVEGK